MNRKIMIEVTPQELEKIQAGKLNVEDMTIEQLANQLIKKLDADDNVRVHRDIEPSYLSRTDVYEFKINDSTHIRLEIARSIL